MKNHHKYKCKFETLCNRRWSRKRQRKIANEFIDTQDESLLKIGFYWLMEKSWHEQIKNTEE